MNRSFRLHPIVEQAGTDGGIPAWAQCSRSRREHGRRVGELLASWAVALDLPEPEPTRWRAAGVLHDALKDASSEELRYIAGDGWPDPVLHAPACAERLAADGVADESLLNAIRYHPVGHPDLDRLGEYLILADYVEPGRKGGKRRAGLREILPDERRRALVSVVRSRLDRQLSRKEPLLDCSVAFWNRLVRP